MNVASLIKHLEVNVAEEIAAKRASLEAIEAQERSIAANDPGAFEITVEAIGKLLPRDARRTAKREHLLKLLSEHWQVPLEALTLGSIVRRLGPEGTRLEELRGELRKVVAAVLKYNRRLSSLIGMHRRLNGDIIQVVLGGEKGQVAPSSGAILDARA